MGLLLQFSFLVESAAEAAALVVAGSAEAQREVSAV